MGPAGLGPPQSQGPGAHHKVEPPIFLHAKFNFYVLFQQVNATATRFTQ